MNNKEISKYIALSDRQTEFEFTVKNNYDFSLKRQNIRLDLIEEADGFLVLSYKGLRYPVEIVSRKQNEYEILLNELKQYNPELLEKQRILDITKCDMLDAELMEAIKPTLPDDLPAVFISSVSGLGIEQLKSFTDFIYRNDNNF